MNINIPSQIDNNLTASTTQGASKTAINTALDGKQPLAESLTQIASILASNDDIIQRKSGSWVRRTMTQLWADLKSFADALYAPKGGYVMQGAATSTSPLDNATHAFADANVGTTTGGYTADVRLYVTSSRTLKRAHIFVKVGGTAGSPQTASIYVVKNGATDILISDAVTYTTAASEVSNDLLNESFLASDFLNFKVVYPTFTTNPGAVTYTVTLEFE